MLGLTERRRHAVGGLDEIPAEPAAHPARPQAASSVAPVSTGYERSLRPCLGTTSARRGRALFRQTLLVVWAQWRSDVDLAVGLEDPLELLRRRTRCVGRRQGRLSRRDAAVADDALKPCRRAEDDHSGGVRLDAERVRDPIGTIAVPPASSSKRALPAWIVSLPSRTR
jgi:hypothetical protein